MADFEAVMKIVGLQGPDIDLVKKAGIKQFTDFVTVPSDELKAALAAEGMTAGDVSDVLAFQRWYHEWRASKPKQGIVLEFTEEVWEDYLIMMCSLCDTNSSMASTVPDKIVGTI